MLLENKHEAIDKRHFSADGSAVHHLVAHTAVSVENTPPQAGFLLPATSAADCCYDCLTNLKTTSLEQLKVFLEKVKGDNSLQEKLKEE